MVVRKDSGGGVKERGEGVRAANRARVDKPRRQEFEEGTFADNLVEQYGARSPNVIDDRGAIKAPLGGERFESKLARASQMLFDKIPGVAPSVEDISASLQEAFQGFEPADTTAARADMQAQAKAQKEAEYQDMIDRYLIQQRASLRKEYRALWDGEEAPEAIIEQAIADGLNKHEFREQERLKDAWKHTKGYKKKMEELQLEHARTYGLI